MQRWKKLRLRILQFYFLRYHGFIKVIIKNYFLIFFQRAHWLMFAENFFFLYTCALYLPVVSHSIIFIKIGTAYFFKIECFDVHIIFGGWSCVISMNRWCLWSGIGVKNNSMSIFYVALSTCSVVLPICHVVLSTWSVVLLICHVLLSHYGTAPIDLRCLHKRRPNDYLRSLSFCRGSRVEGSMSRARVPCRGSRVTFFFCKKKFFWKGNNRCN